MKSDADEVEDDEEHHGSEKPVKPVGHSLILNLHLQLRDRPIRPKLRREWGGSISPQKDNRIRSGIQATANPRAGLDYRTLFWLWIAWSNISRPWSLHER